MTLSHLVLYVFSYIQQLFSAYFIIFNFYSPCFYEKSVTIIFLFFTHFHKAFFKYYFYFVIFLYLTSLMVFMKCNILFGVILSHYISLTVSMNGPWYTIFTFRIPRYTTRVSWMPAGNLTRVLAVTVSEWKCEFDCVTATALPWWWQSDRARDPKSVTLTVTAWSLQRERDRVTVTVTEWPRPWQRDPIVGCLYYRIFIGLGKLNSSVLLGLFNQKVYYSFWKIVT